MHPSPQKTVKRWSAKETSPIMSPFRVWRKGGVIRQKNKMFIFKTHKVWKWLGVWECRVNLNKMFRPTRMLSKHRNSLFYHWVQCCIHFFICIVHPRRWRSLPLRPANSESKRPRSASAFGWSGKLRREWNIYGGIFPVFGGVICRVALISGLR